MRIDQLRDCEQTWDSLQGYVNIFPPSSGYMNIDLLCREKVLFILPNRSMIKDSSSHPNIQYDWPANIGKLTTTLRVAKLKRLFFFNSTIYYTEHGGRLW